MKNKFRTITSCIAALACCVPMAAFAASPSPAASPKTSPAASPKTSPAPKTTPAAAEKTTTTTGKALPFHGMISTVDQTAKTFSIAGKEKTRVFKVTDSTVMTKAGAPATMTDVVANDEVRGSYTKAADGSLEAKTVKLGPATDADKAETKPSKKKAKSDTPAASPSASPSASAKP